MTYFRSINNIYQDREFEIKFKTNNLNSLNNNKKSVCFPGYLNIKEVDKLIKNYQESIFIQMSYSEGQSNSILEAMARGSICIVSQGCNMQNAKNLNSIIITKDSEVQKEINKLLKNNMLIKKLRDNQYRYLREFHSLKKISKQFDEDIKSLL